MDEDTDQPEDSPESWSEEESRVFTAFGRAMIPGREEIERALLDLLPAARDEPFLGVEIGTGTGWLCAAVLREFPRATMVGLDGSKEMLGVARELLAPYQGRVELRPFRLEVSSWVEKLPSPVRVFLSSLVLHHLDGSAKRGLFAHLFERLQPGGALLFADVMEPRTELARRHFADSWSKEIRRRSVAIHGDERAYEFFVGERWNIYEHPDPVDKPSTLPEQLRWLEEAGFEGVDVFWARAGHALLGGYRPVA